jgi:thioredoxin-related protein
MLSKRTILVTALIALAATAAGAGTTFTPFNSWQAARNAAAEQGKYLFVDAYTDWCGWCKVMDAQTFSEDSVARLMDKSFVSTKIEMETGWGINVAMKYRVLSFPQFLVFSPSGELVYRIIGYRPVETFLKDLQHALAPSQQIHFPGITADQNPAWPEFLPAAFAKGSERVMPSEQKTSAWLDACADPHGEVAWTVMSRCPINETWESWILASHDRLADLYGVEAHERVFDLAMERGMAAIKENNSEAFQAALNSLPPQHPSTGEARVYLGLERKVQAGDWKGALLYLREEQRQGRVSLGLANQQCWRVYEESMDTEVIAEASAVMREADKADDYAAWDTYAALLAKAGQYADARLAAEQAIAYGRQRKLDTSETEALLQSISGRP